MSGRIVQAGDVYVYAGYVASGLGATGLTVTIDVWRNRAGTITEVLTAQAATEVGDGLYFYKIPTANVAAGDDFMYTFKTAGTADQKDLQGVVFIDANWTAARAAYLDSAVSGAATEAEVLAVVTAAENNIINNVDSISTQMGAPVGASISADVAAVKADTGGLRTDYTTPRAAYLDATISSRSTLTAAQVWDALLTGITTVGSIGGRIKDYLDIQASTIPALVAAAMRAVVVTFRTPVETEGKISIRAGDDYTAAFGREFAWQLTNRPELVGGVVSLAVDGIQVADDGTVTDGGVDGDGNTLQDVVVEVTALNSSLLTESHWGQRKLFSAQIVQTGEALTEISGTANVSPPHVP